MIKTLRYQRTCLPSDTLSLTAAVLTAPLSRKQTANGDRRGRGLDFFRPFRGRGQQKPQYLQKRRSNDYNMTYTVSCSRPVQNQWCKVTKCIYLSTVLKYNFEVFVLYLTISNFQYFYFYSTTSRIQILYFYSTSYFADVNYNILLWDVVEVKVLKIGNTQVKCKYLKIVLKYST